MGKPYQHEMSRLGETFEWVVNTDVQLIRSVIQYSSNSPLIAIGSGGSLSTAFVLTYLHQFFTGKLARTNTPLDAILSRQDAETAMWIISAGGNNVDVVNLAKALIFREPFQLAVLCGNAQSRLAKLCQEHSIVNLLAYPTPTGKDGFLATNSLMAFSALFARAYLLEFGSNETWSETRRTLTQTLSKDSILTSEWKRQVTPLWDRPTTLVLYGPESRPGAVDLESKFTEAALGNVQISDYRNFAHGRHHWLAKMGSISSVLALTTESDVQLAEKTLGSIPDEIPQARIALPGNSISATLHSLTAAIQICGWAGESRKTDPGKPIVPQFGRKLYHLTLPRKMLSTTKILTRDRDLVAISRKSPESIFNLQDSNRLVWWKGHLGKFREQLVDCSFGGIVMDYDGTLVDIHHRNSPPSQRLTHRIVSFLEAGLWIGITTGRGISVSRDLRLSIPKELWERILIGYYNGAEIADLGNTESPNRDERPCESLSRILHELKEPIKSIGISEPTKRKFQITFHLRNPTELDLLWAAISQTIHTSRLSTVNGFRSHRSIDIVSEGVSKINLVKTLQSRTPELPVLTIGDQGKWPGNDYELLRERYSLSVNICNTDPNTCWNLGRIGQRGPSVTLDYLHALEKSNGVLQFNEAIL